MVVYEKAAKIPDNSLMTSMPGVNIDLDVDSKKGRFGWVEINQVFLPVLYRGEEKAKYISQRAVEKILISNFNEIPLVALLCAEVVEFPAILNYFHSFLFTRWMLCR